MGGAIIGVVQEFWTAPDKDPMAKRKSQTVPRS